MKASMIWICCLQLKKSNETDMDSDASDDKNDGLLHHFPRHLLNSTCDSSFLDKRNKQKSAQCTQPPNTKSRNSAARNWRKGTELQPTMKLLGASAVPKEWKETVKALVNAFKTMFSEYLVLHVTNQNNLYAVQHSKGNLNILEDEIRTFIAVSLVPRNCKVAYQYLYWTDAPDTHNEGLSCAMSRNTFREILSKLHLADNPQITESRY